MRKNLTIVQKKKVLEHFNPSNPGWKMLSPRAFAYLSKILQNPSNQDYHFLADVMNVFSLDELSIGK